MTERYTITALVENRPGVLNRVVSIFRRPGLNLDSLTVGRTERPDVSRMTMVLEGTKKDAVQLERELRKLIHVIKVEDVNGTPHVLRDLALIMNQTGHPTEGLPLAQRALDLAPENQKGSIQELVAALQAQSNP